MTSKRSHKVFVNLPVRDVARAIAFFSGLGFHFNPKFTNDKGACMVLSEEGFVMLLDETFFKTFTRRQLADTSAHIEGLVALAFESRAQVDEIADKALASGATPAMDPQDHGFMYVRSFLDPDGHHWEVFWMDPAAAA